MKTRFIFILLFAVNYCNSQDWYKTSSAYLESADSLKILEKYEGAYYCYTKALGSYLGEASEVKIVILSGLSQCAYMLHNYQSSITYATQALELKNIKSTGYIHEVLLKAFLDNTYATIYYIRASAYQSIGEELKSCQDWNSTIKYRVYSNKQFEDVIAIIAKNCKGFDK